jgi:hypothetical protein
VPHLGKVLVVLGVVLVAAGAWLLLGGRLDWIGRLPGDITFRRGNVEFHFPIVTCLLVSAVLSLLLWLLRK